MPILRMATLAVSMVAACTLFAADPMLEGRIIGTELCHDYETNRPTTESNTAAALFDDDPDTFFATEQRSYSWAGLDLGEPHVITAVGWMPRNDGLGPERVVTAVFQGANREDFMDAVPIYVVTEKGTVGTMSHADVDCGRGFRYVRYVSPGDARCNLAELRFYGHPGGDDTAPLWQVTNLPTVVVNTVNAEEPYDKEHDIVANIMIISADGTDVLEAPGEIRERGNASRTFPKKPWRLKFDKKQQPLGAPAKAKKWTLLNNYGDKSLMRNRLAFDIARVLEMEYVPFCEFVDVVLNGEYKGCYQLCDQVEVGEGRVDITEMEDTDIEGDALTGGYFIECDAYALEEPVMFESMYYHVPVTIKSPDDEDITQEQRGYIAERFNAFEQRLCGAGFLDEELGYETIFDRDSFIRHMLVNELAGNTDTYWSTYMYKHRTDPLFYTGPVWDFDLGFNNDYRTWPIEQTAELRYLWNAGSASFAGGMGNLVRRIIYDDPTSAPHVAQVWGHARNDQGLTPEWLNERIDAYEALLQASSHLNFLRWPILSQQVHMNPVAAGSYAAEVERMRQYLAKRLPQLDAIIAYHSEGVWPDKPDDIPGENAIETLETDVDAPAVYYNLQGQRILTPIPGQLVIRHIPGHSARKAVL